MRKHKSIENVEAYFNRHKEAIASYMMKKCNRATTGKFTNWYANHWDLVGEVRVEDHFTEECMPEGWKDLSKDQRQLDAAKFAGYLNRLRNINAWYDHAEDRIYIVAYDYDRAENYCEYEGHFEDFKNFFDYIWTTRAQEMVNDRKLAEECAELDKLINEDDSF